MEPVQNNQEGTNVNRLYAMLNAYQNHYSFFWLCRSRVKSSTHVKCMITIVNKGTQKNTQVIADFKNNYT